MKPIIRNYSEINFVDITQVDCPEKYLDYTTAILNDIGVDWCFAFGTALGLYRDKGFIPQDTDIDVMILPGSFDPKDIAAQFLDLNLIRTVIFDKQYHQVAFQADDGFIVDLCFFYPDGDDFLSYCEGGCWRDPQEVIGDFRFVDTKYGEFLVPEKIEDYLVIRYGEDWSTPRLGENACSNKSS